MGDETGDDEQEHVCGPECEPTHPFDTCDVDADELLTRESGAQVIDLADKVLAMLAAEGCGAKEAIFACIVAAKYGSQWIGEISDDYEAFDRMLDLADETEADAAAGATPEEMAAMN